MKRKLSLLETEIAEQPEVIRGLLENERRNVEAIAGQVRGQFDYILVAARGSSDNAARYAQYQFGVHNQIQVALATPSLFTLYRRPPRLAGALVVGISQSGQSPDIVAVIAEARRQGRPTIAITNRIGSPLAAAAGHVINLRAGEERAVAATKTYTASLAALALLSSLLADDGELLAQLQNLPGWMEQAIDLLKPLLARVERYRYLDRCAVIGRGYNYATAFEIALKVKELTRVVAEPYSSADFRHGPIAMARDGFPVMVIAPGGAVEEDMRGLAADLRKLEAELVVISDDQALLEQAHLALPLPGGLPEWLSPLVAVIPGQLFGLALAQAKGFDPDQPAGLKKVTETL